MDIKVGRNSFEQAEPAGKALLKKATEEHFKRKEWVNKEVGQASKDIAKHIAGLARGRVSVMIDSDRYNEIFRKKGRYA